MGNGIFELTPEEPIQSYGLKESIDAIIDGNNLCLNVAIDAEPLTYICTNTGGLGTEHGFSYGNSSIIMLLFIITTYIQYMYFLNKIHKTL
tara:strand:- start:765 stop:1037 length:273 start_codon:yes stop_codon:yes gene_type:complete